MTAANHYPAVDVLNSLSRVMPDVVDKDHYAAAGSPRETGNTLHRIDPEIVIAELEEAGFVLEAKSNVLRNMDDDHNVHMAAPDIRGKTDRFVFRFRKPG